MIDGVARGVVMQLLGLHSPADLTITAFSSAQSRTSWEWLEWMPHTGSAHSPLSGNHLTDSVGGGQALMARLEDLLKQRRSQVEANAAFTFGPIRPDAADDRRAEAYAPAVVVLVEDTAPIDRSRLTRLAEQGGAVGIHVIWVATEVANLPAACRTFLLVESETDGASVGQVRHGQHSFPVSCDSIDVADVRQIALLLAPVIDAGAAVEDDTDLPRSVSYLTLAGHRISTDPTAIAQQWISNASVLDRNGPPRPLPNPRACVPWWARRARGKSIWIFERTAHTPSSAAPRVRARASSYRPGSWGWPPLTVRTGSISCSWTTRVAPHSPTASDCPTPSAWSPICPRISCDGR